MVSSKDGERAVLPYIRGKLMASFDNQVVLITGAASGISRALARLLAAEGARIAAVDRAAGGLDGLSLDLKGRPFAAAVADVTDAAAARAAVARLEAELGPTDLLVAGAGIGRETCGADFRAEDVADQVRVNLIGVSNSIAAVLPGMVQRRRGHIAALSSLASYRGLPLMAGYCAAKAGVNALLEGLRVELRPLGVAVSIICPGWVRTPMTANLKLPGVVMMEPEEAARRIAAGLRGRRPFIAFPTGLAWQVRLLRYLPRALSDWMAYRILLRHQAR
jgi:NAD(P)-dependent dehydrogenase (short-subunit alcohol dehydrogenase family)